MKGPRDSDNEESNDEEEEEGGHGGDGVKKAPGSGERRTVPIPGCY